MMVGEQEQLWLFKGNFVNILEMAVLIYNIRMQQRALLHNFSLLNSQDWAIVQRLEKLSIVNNFTADEFIYEKVNSNSQHLFEIYKARAQYVIPNTPQIILATYQAEPYSIEMFVQSGQYKLNKLIRKNLCQTSILELIKNVVKTVEFLVKKFGFFKITTSMIKVTRSNSFLVWIHENFASTHSQYPISSSNIYQDYKIMVNDLVFIFEGVGLKKDMQKVKEKIETERLLSFQKFKIILQQSLKCQQKSKQRSEKNYRSPQFLKKRTSPDSGKRGMTQNFIIEHNRKKDIRFATSLNIGLLSSKSISEMFKEKSESQMSQGYADEKFKRITLSNDSSLKSIKMEMDFDSETFQKNEMVKKGSQNEDFMGIADMKKKNIRDSGNSISTTAFLNSMTSSGKMKMNTFQEHNFAVSNQKRYENKGLASSVGTKQASKIKDLKDTFKVKASKIIEENNEEIATNGIQSFIRGQEAEKSKEESDVQRDLGGLLKSECSSNYRHSPDMQELENEIFNILSG